MFDAWTTPELLQRWWVPRSVPITLLSCELDVRVGGTYRLVFHPGSPFFKRVEAEIEIEAGRDHHVPLLLSPYACAIYRGS